MPSFVTGTAALPTQTRQLSGALLSPALSRLADRPCRSASQRRSFGYAAPAGPVASSSAAAADAGPSQRALRIVKVCGITSVEDAALAIDACKELVPGVQSYIGMILWPKSIRSVQPETAREIASYVQGRGARPVGVFVDESADEMAAYAERIGLDIVQLHGEPARAAYGDLPASLDRIVVCDVEDDGSYSAPALGDGDLLLFDRKVAGSGHSFDWSRFRRPAGGTNWLLAGGVSPDNVARAVRELDPAGIDVASGVAGPDRVRKDPARMRRFFEEIRAAL
eukprot:tig00000802_g4301.t1